MEARKHGTDKVDICTALRQYNKSCFISNSWVIYSGRTIESRSSILRLTKTGKLLAKACESFDAGTAGNLVVKDS